MHAAGKEMAAYLFGIAHGLQYKTLGNGRALQDMYDLLPAHAGNQYTIRIPHAVQPVRADGHAPTRSDLIM